MLKWIAFLSSELLTNYCISCEPKYKNEILKISLRNEKYYFIDSFPRKKYSKKLTFLNYNFVFLNMKITKITKVETFSKLPEMNSKKSVLEMKYNNKKDKKSISEMIYNNKKSIPEMIYSNKKSIFKMICHDKKSISKMIYNNKESKPEMKYNNKKDKKLLISYLKCVKSYLNSVVQNLFLLNNDKLTKYIKKSYAFENIRNTKEKMDNAIPNQEIQPMNILDTKEKMDNIITNQEIQLMNINGSPEQLNNCINSNQLENNNINNINGCPEQLNNCKNSNQLENNNINEINGSIFFIKDESNKPKIPNYLQNYRFYNCLKSLNQEKIPNYLQNNEFVKNDLKNSNKPKIPKNLKNNKFSKNVLKNSNQEKIEKLKKFQKLYQKVSHKITNIEKSIIESMTNNSTDKKRILIDLNDFKSESNDQIEEILHADINRDLVINEQRLASGKSWESESIKYRPNTNEIKSEQPIAFRESIKYRPNPDGIKSEQPIAFRSYGDMKKYLSDKKMSMKVLLQT